MNKKKKLFFSSIIILLILILIYLLIRNKQNNYIEDLNDDNHDDEITIIDEDYNNLLSVIINPEDNFVYTKENQKWIFEEDKNVLLDQERFNFGSEKISNLKASNLIRENATEDELIEFEINLENKITLVYKNNKNYSFFIGMQNLSNDSSYVVFEGDKNIYLISNSYFDDIIIPLNFAIDLNIDFPEINDLKILELVSKKQKTLIELDEEKSNDNHNNYLLKEPFKNKKIELINFKEKLLVPLNRISFESPYYYTGSNDAEYGFNDPNYSIFLKDNNDKTLNILVGKEFQDGLFFAKYNDRQEVFVFSRQMIDTIFEIDYISIIDRIIYSPNILDVEKIILAKDNNIINFNIIIKKTKEFKEIENGTINDKQIDIYLFKKLYEQIISLSIDEININYDNYNNSPYITITYYMNNNEEVFLNFYLYSSKYYLIEKNKEILGLAKIETLEKLFNELLQN